MEKDDKEQMAALPVFRRLVQTAALELSPDEAAQLMADLNDQLKIIRQLDAIPLPQGLDAVIHGNPYSQEIRCDLREDEWIPFENAAEITAQAPLLRDGYIVSPDVPHQRLS